MRVGIVDYGLGNLFNVARALDACGAESFISDQPSELTEAVALVLPGVGAFGEGMANLQRRELAPMVKNAAAAGTPILGICLGMQLLFDESEEFGVHAGLGLIPGRVVRFDEPEGTKSFKIPQIGWNRISGAQSWKGTVLHDVETESFMYFVHSFYVATAEDNDCLATTSYGRNQFCAVASRGKVSGCQFHPEKSGEEGLQIIRNFIDQARA
ncbi:MAG: imidazole glycerol phosphate synthase subunit HisH [Deltaproteobacteria bacterium]|nr:imidazole glycerol phosphate synthase subunit HisH [Deltaproteobacteria bacterium]